MPRRSSLWLYVPPPVIISALIGFWQYRKHQTPAPPQDSAADPVEQIAPRDNPAVPPPQAPSGPNTPPASPAQPSPAATPAAAATAQPARTLDEANALLAELAGKVLPADRIAGWLQQSNLLARIVATVDCIATGASPRDHLDFLAPSGAFRANRAGDGRWYAAAANALRTKATVETFCLADTTAIAATYARLEPVFDQLYQDLGYPNGRFLDAVARACQVLLSTSIPAEAPALVRTGTVYRFADPALEALKPAQKHLIRLGIDDARRVQEKVWKLAQALGIAAKQ